MADDIAYTTVLAAYPADCRPLRIAALGSAGGLSGARFWRLETALGPLALRRWPSEHPTKERLEFIQAVLWHAGQEGFDKAPIPLETRSHHGYVVHAGHLWQLEPWMPGEVDRSPRISVARLRAAMRMLAEFHGATVTFPLDVGPASSSLGITERLLQLRKLTDDNGHARLAHAVSQSPQAFDVAARRLLELFPRAAPRVRPMLEQAARLKARIQPCLRDVWRDNVLFTGDEVSGLVDFGALRPETVAADVARLLGSLAADDQALWQAGITAYAERRPLTEAERRLVAAFDASTVLMGGMQWLEWLYEQQRVFDDPAAVQSRLDYFCQRLAEMTMKS